MPELKDFKVGDTWVTRAGQRVTICGVAPAAAESQYPVWGYDADDPTDDDFWTGSGRTSLNTNDDRPRDLVRKAGETRVAWVHVYRNEEGQLLASSAFYGDVKAASSRIAVGRVRLVLEEGRFDD